jgi:hypothetical protein
MKLRYSVLLLSLTTFTALLPLENCLAENGNNYHSNENGYTLGIPGGWQQIPFNIIREYLRQLASPEGQSTIFFETAFQREAKDGLWFQSPYAIVQILKYTDFFPNWQPKESEFEYIVKQISGIDPVKVVDELLSPAATTFVTDPTIGQVYLHLNNKLYTFTLEIKQPNDQSIKGQIVGHFGKYAIVQVMFYDLESNWSESKSERNILLSSFDFDASFRYVPIENSLGIHEGIETKADKSALKRIFEAIVGGAGAFLIIAAVILGGLFLKSLLSNKKKEDSSPDSNQKAQTS